MSDGIRKYHQLRERFLELQKDFLDYVEDYEFVRQDYLTERANRLKVCARTVRTHATIIHDRYGRHDDLNYCSTQILQHTHTIEEIASEIAEFDPNP